MGSPPRVRGTVLRLRNRHHITRITPACAGNRNHGGRLWLWGWDHPRVCGEQTRPAAAILSTSGSPPRVRGTVQNILTKHIIHGITPACAGNRSRPLLKYRALQDHPRVCGEQVSPCSPCGPFMGSPPRVRGTDRANLQILGRYGITPACAGNRLTG